MRRGGVCPPDFGAQRGQEEIEMRMRTVVIWPVDCGRPPEAVGGIGHQRSPRSRRRRSGLRFALVWGSLLLLAVQTRASDEAQESGLFEQKPDVARLIVGFEQAAASAAESERKYFIDFTVEVGFGRKDTWSRGAYGPLFRTWGTVRLTSVPQQINVPVGEFATQFDQNLANLKVNELVQAGELLTGFELMVATWPHYKSTDFRRGGVSLSVTAAGGVITPLDPQSSLRVFELTDEARQTLGIDASKNYVAFVSKDRDRFFRQWYAGFRLRTHYGSSTSGRLNSILDVSVGQDEAITGGRLYRSVLRAEGFFPLEWGTGFLYLYGGVLIRPGPVREKEPLLLRPAPAGVVVPAPDVEVRTIPQVDKDFYRIGVGVDLVRLVEQFRGKHVSEPPKPQGDGHD